MFASHGRRRASETAWLSPSERRDEADRQRDGCSRRERRAMFGHEQLQAPRLRRGVEAAVSTEVALLVDRRPEVVRTIGVLRLARLLSLVARMRKIAIAESG